MADDDNLLQRIRRMDRFALRLSRGSLALMFAACLFMLLGLIARTLKWEPQEIARETLLFGWRMFLIGFIGAEIARFIWRRIEKMVQVVLRYTGNSIDA